MLQSSASRYSDCVAPGRAKPRLGSLPSTGAALGSAGFQKNCAAAGVAKQAIAIAARDKFRATLLMFIIVLLAIPVIIPLLRSLHLPQCWRRRRYYRMYPLLRGRALHPEQEDRKSTRLHSSH